METTDRIDLTAQGQAIHPCFDQKTHNTKLVHDILPTNHRVHRYNKTWYAKCPLCEHPDEDQDHILRCPNAVCRKCDNLRMHPILTKILLQGISECLNGETRDYLLEMNNTEKHLSGMLWTSAIIQEVWRHWQFIWTQRNHTINGYDKMRRSAVLHHRAENILHEIYSRIDFMKPRNHNKILFEDIERHLAQSTNQIMNWISVHKPLISHSIKETNRLVIRGVSPIRT